MPSTIDHDLKEARRIVFEKLEGLAVRVFLFGSRARDDAHRTSDIDVAIESGAAVPAFVMAELRDALEESGILPRVDVVDLATASEELRESVRREGIEWTA